MARGFRSVEGNAKGIALAGSEGREPMIARSTSALLSVALTGTTAESRRVFVAHRIRGKALLSPSLR